MDTIALDTSSGRVTWRLTAPGILWGGLITGGTRPMRTRLATDIANAFTARGLAGVDYGDPEGHIGRGDYDSIMYEADTIDSLNTALTHRFTDPGGPDRYPPAVWNCILVVEDLPKILAHPEAGPGLERLIMCGSKVGMAVIALAETEPECTDAMSALRHQNRIALPVALTAARSR